MMNEHLQEFLRVVEEWIRVYRSVEIAGLPGTERRAQLEKIMWQALQEIVEYSKSEEAAKKAEEKNTGALHSALHPSFDRAAKGLTPAYQMSVREREPYLGRVSPPRCCRGSFEFYQRTGRIAAFPSWLFAANPWKNR